MTPIKGKLIYKLITKQNGQIYLPDTIKNRSTSSVIVSIGTNNLGLNSGDLVLHNMKYNSRVEHFYVNGESHKIMDISDVYAKVLRGNIIPVNDWLFCKMVIPESIIDNAFSIKDCKEVILSAVSLSIDDKIPLEVGGRYLLGGWDTTFNQFQFDGSCYMFLKVKDLVAKVVKESNVVPLFNN